MSGCQWRKSVGEGWGLCTHWSGLGEVVAETEITPDVCGKCDGPTRAACLVVLSYKFTITLHLGIKRNSIYISIYIIFRFKKNDKDSYVPAWPGFC